MKLRLRQEDLLEDRDGVCMRRFKQNTEFDVIDFVTTVFFRTEIPKKIAKVKSSAGQVVWFEEWEPGAFEKTFEVL